MQKSKARIAAESIQKSWAMVATQYGKDDVTLLQMIDEAHDEANSIMPLSALVIARMTDPQFRNACSDTTAMYARQLAHVAFAFIGKSGSDLPLLSAKFRF